MRSLPSPPSARDRDLATRHGRPVSPSREAAPRDGPPRHATSAASSTLPRGHDGSSGLLRLSWIRPPHPSSQADPAASSASAQPHCRSRRLLSDFVTVHCAAASSDSVDAGAAAAPSWASGRPDTLDWSCLLGSARLKNGLAGCAWAVGQARPLWAVPGRAGPLPSIVKRSIIWNGFSTWYTF
jgi:hypothetical protein